MTVRKAQSGQNISFLPFKLEKAYWRKALKKAEETGNVDALIRGLIHIGERQHGTPYQAINPNAAPEKPVDNRLMVAIERLHIGTAVNTQVSQLPAPAGSTQVIESTTTGQGIQACHESSSDCDIQALANRLQITGKLPADSEPDAAADGPETS